MKILFLVPYPLKQAPSQRFRFEQYFELLSGNGFTYEVHSFLTARTWSVFYAQGKTGSKLLVFISGFVKRILLLFKLHPVDFVFIHREALPAGPPVLEWIIAKVLRKKIIYDFDDAIWMTDNRTEHLIHQLFRWRKKVKSICRWSYKVSCGNQYLCDYATQVNANVVLNPTTVDTIYLHNKLLYPKIHDPNFVIVGWTGSHSTVKYLATLEPVLQHLERTQPHFRFLVIADTLPKLNLSSLIYKRWSTATEIRDLLMMDIGIMPLPDDAWSKGKCGFKALQYLALEIPAVVSPVGVNTKIITEGVNGFLCASEKEWAEKLGLLIQDASLRERMGKQGRNMIESHYSTTSNGPNFLSLFV
jgi:glycosyltransferase involved in cell wall biosynthesis